MTPVALPTPPSTHQLNPRLPFAIAFDIDGVILRGRQPIGGSPHALRNLYHLSGALKVPYIFLTNGGGVPESKRALVLSELLDLNILPPQVLQGHTLFKNLLGKYQNELIVVTGMGNPASVMREYGFNKVLSLEEYASFFNDIDPVAQYKNWTSTVSGNAGLRMPLAGFDVYTERVKAAFVASDPVDWGLDIQVLCDILRSGGLPGQENGDQPALYFAADDLEYQAEFPVKRLGRGAFRIALESVFNRIHHTPLEYTTYGKPEPVVFENAEAILQELHSSCTMNDDMKTSEIASPYFRAIYMIGDNPSVDVKGARQAGHPWISVLTRTGVFRGPGNDSEYPADLVVDTVEDAVDYILEKELSLSSKSNSFMDRSSPDS